MSSQTMHHGATIFAKREACLSAQYQMIAEVLCWNANITF